MVDISKISDGTNTYDIKDSEARSELSNKQDTLVSGTNIKTINGTSILGSGNIVIESSSTPDVDSETISYNTSNALQSIAVKNKRDGSTLPIWQGSEYQWNHGEETTWYNWRTASSQGGWTSGGNIPENSDFVTGIAYGNGKFVAVGSFAHGYSTDGITWTSFDQPPGYGLFHSIIYAYNMFIVVGNNTVYTSTDGINWNETSSGAPQESVGIAYGEGKIVSVGFDSDKVIYSTDGINWNSSTLPAKKYWVGLAYGNGRFVAITANSDTVAYSTDGITWNTATLPISGSWGGITFGNGKFVACNAADDNYLYISTDGINWASIRVTGLLKPYGVIYADGKFLVVPSGGDIAAFSTDGENWTLTQMGTSESYFAIGYGNNKFIVSSQTGSTNVFSQGTYLECYTDTANPTTTSTVYSAPEVTSSSTILSVTSGVITLSNNNTYYYNQSGNAYTYQTVGNTHPDWLCNIDNIGVKIGNTIVATAGGSGPNYTAGTGINITNNEISANIATSVSSTSTNEQSVGAKLFYDTLSDIESTINTIRGV